MDTLTAAILAGALDKPPVDLLVAVLQLLGFKRISHTGAPAA
jgi:hypothetical protein